MSVVYYPKSSIILKRDTISASYEQIVLSTQPNTILYFGTGSDMSYISASTIYITASNALTASYMIGTITSASYVDSAVSSSYSLSSSYSPVQPSYSSSVSSTKQNLLTNTTYTLTASLSTTASYSTTSSYASLARTSSYFNSSSATPYSASLTLTGYFIPIFISGSTKYIPLYS